MSNSGALNTGEDQDHLAFIAMNDNRDGERRHGSSGATSASAVSPPILSSAFASRSLSQRDSDVPTARVADPLLNGHEDDDSLLASVAEPLLTVQESKKLSKSGGHASAASKNEVPRLGQTDSSQLRDTSLAHGFVDNGSERDVEARLVDPPVEVASYGIPMASSTWEPEVVQYTRPGRHLVSLFLTIGTALMAIGCLVTIEAPQDEKEPWQIALVVFGALYLIEAFIAPFLTRSTLKFLCNMEHTGMYDFEHNFFVTLRQMPPRLCMHIECYHYESRTRVVREAYKDSHGNTHHRDKFESYQERVVTYRKSEDKKYASWIDLSGPGPRLSDVDPKYVGILVHVEKHVEPADEATEADLAQQARTFQENYRLYDTHFDYSESVELQDYRPTIFLHDAERTPWYIGPWTYIFATLCLCSWPYRVYLQRHVMEGHFKVRSRISVFRDAFMPVRDATIQE
mmetsp:Transcript_12302/g.23903  ORF Transcript_12302/g.23903 Transcript_12302/m.23903 type:complete len:457 (+) Transcript_12302:116-1486(+)